MAFISFLFRPASIQCSPFFVALASLLIFTSRIGYVFNLTNARLVSPTNSFKHNTSFVSRLSTIRRHKAPLTGAGQQQQQQQIGAQNTGQSTPSSTAATTLTTTSLPIKTASSAPQESAALRRQQPAEQQQFGMHPEPACEGRSTAASALYAPLALVGATSQAIDMDTIAAFSNQKNQQHQVATVTVTSSSPGPSTHDVYLAADEPAAGQVGQLLVTQSLDASAQVQTRLLNNRKRRDSIKSSSSVSSLAPRTILRKRLEAPASNEEASPVASGVEECLGGPRSAAPQRPPDGRGAGGGGGSSALEGK